MFKLKRDLVPLSVIICLLATLCFVFAQETLTITTYYPSPYGSYQDLETGNLTFRRDTDGLVHFNYNTTTYNRRLRITAGLNDSGNNDQGASIDLHGVNATTYLGRLDLVAGRGSNVTFWSSPAGSNATERMRITDAGRVGIGEISPTPSLFHVATSTTAAGVSTFEQASTLGIDSYDLIFRRTRGTVALPTVITTGDYLGTINFAGYSGAGGYILGAAIRAISEGTIATTRVPARLSFWTGTDATPTALTERMRIDRFGNVGIGTTAPLERLEVAGGIRASLTPTTYTTLSGAMDATQTSATVALITGYPTAGTLLIDSEAMTYTGTNTATNSFTGLTRGVLGTTPAVHSAGATVKNYLFIALASATTAPRMVITGDGYVGIGTATPTANLNIVGTIGGSLYTTNWADVTFAGSWTNYLNGWQSVQYKRVGDLVFLRGFAQGPTGVPQTIFTLPAEYRPPATLAFPQLNNAGTGVAIQVQSGGNVIVVYGNDGKVHLTGIVFSVD